MRPMPQSFRCLDAVARHGSVRKAAETLHLSAAAAGTIVLAAVRRMQRDFEQALGQVGALRTLEAGRIALGVPHASAEGLMPRVIQAMRRDYPGIGFDVHTGNGEALLLAVAGGEVDIAFCLQRVPPPGVVQLRDWPHPTMRWRSMPASCACATAWLTHWRCRRRAWNCAASSTALPAASASGSSRWCRPLRWRWCARWRPRPDWSAC